MAAGIFIIRCTIISLLALALATGCGKRPLREGLFTGSRAVVNTYDPAFQYRDNDAAYVPPRGYSYAPPKPATPQPQPFNPDKILQNYYANPTDSDENYVPPRYAIPQQDQGAPSAPYQPYRDNDESYSIYYDY